MTTWRRPLATLGLALLLSWASPVAGPARAQDPGAPPAGGEGGGETGEPLYGYLGTGVLAGLAAFILCKSSRRSA